VTEVSGRSTAPVVNGWAIAGDNNNVVALNVSGVPYETVDIPASSVEAGRLLFGPPSRPGSALVGSWLRPDAGVIAVEPRPEVDALVGWCSSGRGALVRLVRASGGQGKTHLAGQVCTRLRERGWLAGFVRLPPLNWRTVTLADLAKAGVTADRLRRQMRRVPELVAAIHAVARLNARVLLVVDYAENSGQLVAELLDVIADASAEDRVRVLLLARTDAGWFRDLTDDHPLHDWIDPQPVPLGALSADWDMSQAGRVWTEAVSRFADQAAADGMHVDRGRLAAADAGGREFATTLDLYADALLTVLDTATLDNSANVTSPGGDPVTGVLAHERRQISAGLHSVGLGLDDRQRDWALATVALRSATDLDEGAQALAPALTGWDEDARVRLARRLGELYPDPAGVELWQAPVPDRLTDTHLLDLARQAASQKQWCTEVSVLCATDDAQAAQRSATVLHRCLSTPGGNAAGRARVASSISALVRGFPGVYVPVMTLLDPAGFTDDLTAVIGDSTPAMAITDVRSLDQILRNLGFATTRTAVAVAISQRLVADLRPAAGGNPEDLNEYAGQLNNLSVRLGQLGRREEGLAASEEAVTICRRLADANPAAYLPNLAGSLNNLSVDLGGLGRREEGLAASEEVVTICRRLADADPAAYLPDLAGSLNNLSIRLVKLGRHEEAKAAEKEATQIRSQITDH
jgi:hypothetical protein